MGIVVNTNISSLISQNNLNKTQNSLQTTLERLSSGKRINHAGDDAAGLVISSRMLADIGGMGQAKRNANDGISMVQTAEGALSGIANSLSRMKELAIQAASGTYATADKVNIQKEVDALVANIGQIANTGKTTFNGVDILASATVKIQVNIKAGDTIDIDFKSATASTLNLDTARVGTSADVSAFLANVSSAIDTISGNRAALGAVQNRLGAAADNLETTMTNLSQANSGILDVDFAQATAQLAKLQILQQAGGAMLARSNQSSQIVLSLLQG